MSRLREILLVAAALTACTKGETPKVAEAATDAGAQAEAGPVAEAGAAAKAEPLEDLLTPPVEAPQAFLASPKRAKSVGHTSVVYRVDLASDERAAFRPGYRKGPSRYKGEIAAFRLGRELGLFRNVLRAYPRTMSAKELATALGAPLPPDVIVAGDDVKGAIVPWIAKLEFLEVDKEPLGPKWRNWMKKGVEIDDVVTARQLATMIVFDWVTGNWDRWSGGNVGFDRNAGTVLFIDNDGAFFETPPAEHLARQWKLLESMDRFPRALVMRLRTLDADALAKAIGDESPGVPLLSAKALAGVDERRKKLLALVDAKIGDAGTPDTLYFP